MEATVLTPAVRKKPGRKPGWNSANLPPPAGAPQPLPVSKARFGQHVMIETTTISGYLSDNSLEYRKFNPKMFLTEDGIRIEYQTPPDSKGKRIDRVRIVPMSNVCFYELA